MAKTRIWLIPNSDNVLREGGQTPSLYFDCVSSYSPSFQQTVTSYPISDKSLISNHRVQGNDTISITGYISSRPLEIYENNLVGYEDVSTRTQTAYNILKGWKQNGVRIAAVDQYDIIPNCIITSLEMLKEGTDALTVNLTLESVRRVSYQRVTLVQNMDTVKQTDATPNKGAGSRSKKDLTEKDTKTYTNQVLALIKQTSE